jgi:hypothetical protein
MKNDDKEGNEDKVKSKVENEMEDKDGEAKDKHKKDDDEEEEEEDDDDEDDDEDEDEDGGDMKGVKVDFEGMGQVQDGIGRLENEDGDMNEGQMQDAALGEQADEDMVTSSSLINSHNSFGSNMFGLSDTPQGLFSGLSKPLHGSLSGFSGSSHTPKVYSLG